MNTRKMAWLAPLALVVSLVLSACAPSRLQTVLENAGKYFKTGVNLETSWSAKYADFQQSYSNGGQSILDQNIIAKACFTNSREAVEGLLSGMFDKKEANGQSTGVVDQKAFISALALNQTYPDIKACQQAQADLVKSAALWRQDNGDKLRQNTDFRKQYTDFLNDDVAKRVFIEALNSVADKFPSVGIPASFVGFPTDSLVAESRDQKICEYYQQKAATEGLYKASWNPALRTCKLQRMAAYEYMSRLFISAESSTRFDCGTDAGIFDKVGPDCKVKP